MTHTILASSIAGMLTIVGILMLKLAHRYALRYSHYINSFAAGLILAAAISALLPQAIREGRHNAGVWALGGFAVFLILETFLVFHSGAEVHYSSAEARKARGVVFFWGLFLHSLLDGIIIAIGFAAGPGVGLVTALAVVSHELPEGITTFSLLLSRMSGRQALLMSLAVALATPTGGLVGLGLLPVLTPSLTAGAAAFVAGSFVYVAATDMVPEIREEHSGPNIIAMLAGMAFLVFLHQLIPQ